MKKAALIPFLMITIFILAGIVSADKLEIDKVEIISEGLTLLSTSSSTSSLNVDPGDILNIEIRIENLFDDSTDNHIEDVRINAAIYGIDDEDDIDDSEETNLLADRSKTVKLRLKIPSDASSYESYNLVINARGTDQNGTTHSDEVTIEIDVDRKENELIFDTVQVSDVDCDGYTNFRAEIQNIGEEEEQDVELRLISNELGTVWSDRFDLYSINDNEYRDSIYTKALNLDMGALSPGTHYLKVEVLYDNTRKSIDQTIMFNVDDCKATTQSTKEETTLRTTERYSNPNRDTSLLFNTGDAVAVQLPPPGVDIPTPPKVPASDSDDGFGTFVLLLANIAIIIFIILLAKTLRD